MANSPDFVAFALEQMVLFAPVGARRMFGGHGLYVDDLMFAIIVNDTLYLKADAETQARFKAKALPPFTYKRAGSTAVSFGYFEAPPEVFDDQVEMRDWARQAHEAALRSKSKPGKRSARSA